MESKSTFIDLWRRFLAPAKIRREKVMIMIE
jgi:hypothetical protein